MEQSKITLSDFEFAALGKGEVGYIRQMKSDELTRRFPALNKITPGLDVWALFAANGEPIILSDRHSAVLQGASENEIMPVWLN
ncbi:MAG: DUF1150 family protein [Rhizobiaceae bacterium]